MSVAYIVNNSNSRSLNKGYELNLRVLVKRFHKVGDRYIKSLEFHKVPFWIN